jgi:hypothetical protein
VALGDKDKAFIDAIWSARAPLFPPPASGASLSVCESTRPRC